MSLLPIPDWPRWFRWKMSQSDFEQRCACYLRCGNDEKHEQVPLRDGPEDQP